MIDDFARDLQSLHKANTQIGKIWFDVMPRRSGLFAFAGLIAILGLVMMNGAGFYALREPVGAVWAAVIIAIADFGLAAAIFRAAKNSKPGPELELATDVRKMAMDSLQADLHDLQASVDAFIQEIRDTKDTIVAFVHNPWDAIAQNVLAPAGMSILNGLRSISNRLRLSKAQANNADK